MSLIANLLSRLRRKLQKLSLKKRLNLTPRTELVAFLHSVHPILPPHLLIRLGGMHDGGYLLPDDLAGIQACFSPGVATSANFEADLAKIGIPSFMADFSVDHPPIQNPMFHFDKKFLGIQNDVMHLTLESWVNRYAPNPHDDLLLQMDIEGAEYGVLIATPIEILRRFRIIVIEFHDLDCLFYRSSFNFFKLAFDKLLSEFNVVHIHPNNFSSPIEYDDIQIPPLLEFTFQRKDRLQLDSFASQFPHPVDSPCCPELYDLALPKCWYRNTLS